MCIQRLGALRLIAALCVGRLQASTCTVDVDNRLAAAAATSQKLATCQASAERLLAVLRGEAALRDGSGAIDEHRLMRQILAQLPASRAVLPLPGC